MRTVRFLLFVTLAVGVLALGFPRQAQAYSWGTVTVDANGYVGWPTSVAVDTDGDPMISYGYDQYPNGDLKFAICDRSVSANGNCDQAGDWSTTTVDSQGSLGESSIAVDANRNPMISYFDDTIPYDGDLKFAVCDRLASMNGNCNQIGDWETLTVEAQGDVGWYLDITVDSAGSPMISYADMTDYPDWDLKFAICDRSASVNGTCDQAGDWNTVTVDSQGFVGLWTSIAVGVGGAPMISYQDESRELKFATCDRSASATGYCDQGGDWSTMTVDTAEILATENTSIAVDADGNPLIAYGHWYYEDSDLKFATCDRSASVTGTCNQAGDWSTATVESAGDVGYAASIAVGVDGAPMISYFDGGNADLKFAIGSPPPATPTPPAATETATATPLPTATPTVTAAATPVTTASPTPVVTATPTRTPTPVASPGASPTPTKATTPAAAPPTGADGPPSSRFPWWAFLVASGLAAIGVAGLVTLKRSES